MGVHVLPEELAKGWSLSFADLEFVNAKPVGTRLGLAAQLKFFAAFGYFATTVGDIPDEAASYLAEQLGVGSSALLGYEFSGRSGRRHCAEILRHLGIRRMRRADRATLEIWIATELCPCGMAAAAMLEDVFLWCRDHRIFAPSRKEMDRLVRAQRQHFVDTFLERVSDSLRLETIAQMEASLADPDGVTGFHTIKADPGAATLENMLSLADQLVFIKTLHLPMEVLSGVGKHWIDQIVRRVGAEKASEMRRHSAQRQLAFYAVFLMVRQAQIIDGMIDLLVETVHKIGVRSKRKVVAGIAKDIEKVYGKEQLLVDIAGAAIERPDGVVCDVIFPVAGQDKLAAIIKEYRTKGTLERRVYAVMRGSYANHYRRILPKLLSALEFRSNNAVHRPVLEALEWIKLAFDTGCRVAPRGAVPIDGVIPAKWRTAIIGKDARINRISYELCVLSQLRDRIRAKEIWVVGADRYRNPDDDLPTDFESRRSAYYDALNLTPDARAFTRQIRAELERELRLLNAELPRNDKVRILWRGENRISITPFQPLPEPQGLQSLKGEIGRRWPMTELLDVLKETALDTGFLDTFETSATRVALSRSDLDRRLILCLYGLGTNAGLKRVAAGCPDVSYEELLHVGRRFIHRDALEAACGCVVNQTLAVRNTAIWGEAGTACASDSKKFGAWDGNMMTEWHVRYGGRGVMIYWHVEKGSTCIFSQLKRCSSSEVASTIKGVLRHCTDIEIQRQYVDSHGQSTIGFAFCHLLGFELAPRLKAVSRQKLALPHGGLRAELPSGEIASNRLEDQESSALALHLLQNCLVYVNTRMMQAVLVETTWAGRLAAEDYRGLTPLIYSHVNPYGRFDLDLERRIDFRRKAA
ncbi:Tn3 family transposase [Mesorhizobium carmichaelinearum]|uniref:Tn3 family transposase n=1 Tax=Mesorhizobium carmichaelinearum TaxID=1208188 RepID=UPI000BA4673F